MANPNFWLRGKQNYNWKGGTKYLRVRGKVYRKIYCPEHPRSRGREVHICEHVLVAEKAFGKSLPPNTQVHHVNEDTLDNQNDNLVICENNAYHQLLHQRKKAFSSTGDANSKRCTICGEWIWPDEINVRKYKRKSRPNGCGRWFHGECVSDYERSRRENYGQ